ncbi:MAG: hypothetical protein K9I68_11175 [Bacteroidales bacterium]|nr:hypothetical protein [Bacteroidales bacterium]MCF8338088.1 hypothetical protein [Bacteroidales bacterium]
MKIEDIIDKMSKSYLDRIVKGYAPILEKDEEGYRKQIRDNIDDFFSDKEKIRERLSNYIKSSKKPHQTSLLLTFVLKTLIASHQYSLKYEDLVDKVVKAETEIINNSEKKEYFKHLDKKSLEIFETILSAAFEDNYISEDELYLIRKVRKTIGFQENDQYLLQAKLKSFPKDNNTPHTHNEINQCIIDLQKYGIVFYCNRLEDEDHLCVIPEELVDGVKSFLGIDLTAEKYRLLLKNLSKEELQDILESINIKFYDKKENIIDRLVVTGITASEALDVLTTNRLSEICKKLNIKTSGSKNDKINRIIKYYDGLINVEVEDTEDKRKVYYDFFEQLAKRDLQNLLGKNIIKQERDIDLAFEEATKYIFEEKLNYKVIDQEGTEHSDGCLKFQNGDLLLWDNKSLNDEKYTFPNSHLKQFKRYIRDVSNKGGRVSCFLIIVPDFEESAKDNALKLKYESGSDTDISIISAENLKMIAEEWTKNKDKNEFNLQVFNTTGLLTREETKNRMKLFL